MDDEEETYRLWKIRKTIMQVRAGGDETRRGVLSGQRGLRGGLAVPRRPGPGHGPRPRPTPPPSSVPGAVRAGPPDRRAFSVALPRPGLPGDPGRAGPDAGGVQGAVW